MIVSRIVEAIPLKLDSRPYNPHRQGNFRTPQAFLLDNSKLLN
jgi:hypothetical protein